MESEKVLFAPVFKNKGPRASVDALTLSQQDFFEKFLPSHLDKVAIILLTHPEVDNIDSMKEMLEEQAKVCSHLRFYLMDMESHSSLAEQYFHVEDLPTIAIILPSNQKNPDFIDPQLVGELNKKLSTLEADMQKKFDQMKTVIFLEIEKKINSKKVYAFIKGTPTQPRCKFTRRLLESFEGLKLEEIGFGTTDILDEQVFRQWVPFYSEWPTFPQIYINGKFVGGVDVVTEMVENQEFQQLLEN